MRSSDSQGPDLSTDTLPAAQPENSSTTAWGAISTCHARPDRIDPEENTEPVAATGPGAPSAARALDTRALEHYELIRELGRGGMGVVHLARDLRLGRLVAIKMLTEPGHLQERFLAEARATAQCRHENIVVIHDVGLHREQPYLVFEYLRGQTLREWMDARPGSGFEAPDSPGEFPRTPAPLAPARAAEMIVPVVRALVCAHDTGIIHRDLKPANILLTDEGVTKVLDFGVAKIGATREDMTAEAAAATGKSLALTDLGTRMGTLPYMSPEQIAGELVDHRSDIWAVGIILYELVTGAHPLAPLSPARLETLAERETPMPSVRERRSDLGPLADTIDRCLLKDREHRTATARKLLQELEALLPAQRTRPRDQDSNPFAGLAAFQEADADRFFGRDHDIASLIGKLRSLPLVAVTGPSGAGKSSLVRAGVIPALRRSSEGWEAMVTRLGRRPLAALAEVLLALPVRSSEHRAGEEPARGMDQAPAERDAIMARLRAEPGYLGIALRTWARAKLRRLVLFVDQFEELYTLGADAEERACVLACLGAVADDVASPLRVILTVRSDFLDRLVEQRTFLDTVTSGLTFVPPLDRDGLREALIRPLEGCDHRFESQGMVERILDELEATRNPLPLLQFTADKLWARRDRQERVLTDASLRALGGVSGALASHAEDTLARMLATHRGLVREIFRQLVTADGTRAVLTRRELREILASVSASREADDVIEELVRARLLVASEGDTDEARIEVAHEALLSSWPRLAAWRQEDAEGTRLRDQLRTAARQWVERGRSRGILWRGDALLEYRVWRSRYPGSLTDAEEAFARASLHEEERGRRRRLVALAAAFAGLAVSLVLTLAMNARTARERDRATVAGRTTQQVLGFLVDLFEVSDPFASAGRDVSARELLDRGKDEIDQLAAEPEVQATLLHVMGVVYGNIGLYQESAALLEDAVEKRRGIHGDRHLAVAESLHELASTLGRQQVWAPAERAAREALSLRQALLGSMHLDTAETMEVLATVQAELGKYGEARALFEQVIATRRQLLGAMHRDVARALRGLATMHLRAGENEEAARWYQESLDMYRRLPGDQQLEIADTQYHIGNAEVHRDRLAEAKPLFEESLATSRRLLGNEHPMVARTMLELARLHQRAGASEQAEPLFHELLAFYRKSMGDKSLSVAQTLTELAFLARTRGDCAEADALSREFLAISDSALQGDHDFTAAALANRAFLLASWGDQAAARPLSREALDMYLRLHGDSDPFAAAIMANLADVHVAQGELSQAEALLARASEMLRQHPSAEEWLAAYVDSVRGASLGKAGHAAAAERLLLSSHESMRELHGPYRYYTRAAAGRVIAFYESQGRAGEASRISSWPRLPPCASGSTDNE
jgi:serine/threonine protein kinase/tetratricopeptide (TPR) repeat protein